MTDKVEIFEFEGAEYTVTWHPDQKKGVFAVTLDGPASSPILRRRVARAFRMKYKAIIEAAARKFSPHSRPSKFRRMR